VRRPKPHHRLLAALALLLAPACGVGDASAQPPVVRLLPRPLSEVKLPEARRLAVHRAPLDPADWAAFSAGEAEPRCEDGALRFPTAAGGRFTLEEPLPAGTNRIVVVARQPPGARPARLRLASRDGEGQPVPLPVPARTPLADGQVLFVMDAPLLPGRGALHGLEGALEGGPVDVELVELWDRPPAAALPLLGGPGGAIAIDTDARHGWGLPLGIPVACALPELPAGARLLVSAGLTTETRMAGRRARVRVEVTPRGAESGTVLELPLPDATTELTGWVDQSLDLADLAGEAATVRIELLADGSAPAACALAGLALVRGPAAAPDTAVLVTSDTHRADHLGRAARPAPVRTPHLDRLADRGVLFEQAFASTNVTSPSHAALLTGVHPRDSRLTSNTGRLLEEARTLGEAYQEAGWWTIAVVSVRHLGPQGTHVTQGFDRVWAPVAPPPRADLPIEEARTLLAEAAGRPVFLWLHLFDAHDPYEPPKPWADAYWDPAVDPFDPSAPELDWAPGTYSPRLAGLRHPGWPVALYRGEVSWLDEALAPLLDEPRVARGVVAFTADHGEELDGGWARFDHRTLTGGVLQVPLLLAGPGLPQGARVPGTVRQLDLGRTLLDASGLGASPYPGRNLLRHLESEAGDAPEPVLALSAHGFSASLTEGRWHLVLQLRDQGLPLLRPAPAGRVGLFDLEADPLCTEGLEEREPARARAMLDALLTRLRAREHAPLARERAASDTDLAELAALGYATGEADRSDEAPWVDPAWNADLLLDRPR
jgi:arylsulfatase A-like enzyme